MAASDAKAIPVKGAAYRVTFPILDADGDLVTAAATLDSEVSKDAGAFADCTNEATEIATSSGMYYLDLTATEMDADTVAVIVKTGTAGAKTTPIVIYTAARNINDLAYPTVTGRSIDVSAGGEVGLDWANVGSPTTTVGLSGTTVKTATDVETDTADIQARLPAALVSGRIDASVGAMATGVVTAAAIAADAITDAKVASDVTIASVTGSVGSVVGAVGSVTGAVGSVTGNVGGNVTGSVGSVATGGITSASFAAGAIDAAAIAANAIGASELAADAVTEIQAGLSTLDAAGVRTAVGLASANLDTQLGDLPTAAENFTAVLTTAMTESYAADGVAPTLAQAVFAIQQFLQEKSISGTTLTVKKLDGTTTAMSFTLNDATTPTSVTRAS